MHVKEIWRYPVKSMAGERLSGVQIDKLGVAGDRKVLVRGGNGHVVTSRTHHQLLGLKGTLGADGQPQISGHVWDSPEALALVRKAVGADAELFYCDGPERFDVLPLLVATDGAVSYMGFDSRRLRPNIIVGGVEGLQEREWPGHRFRIGEAVIHAAQTAGPLRDDDIRSRHLKTGYGHPEEHRPQTRRGDGLGFCCCVRRSHSRGRSGDVK